MDQHPVVGDTTNARAMWHCPGYVHYKNRRRYCDGTTGPLTPATPWVASTPAHWVSRDGRAC